MSLQTSENPAELLSQFTGSDRHVLDYLIEEVLEKQPKDIRDFLLQTSILRRLSPSLCEAVTERSDSHSLLEQMEKRNLSFVPLDNQRQWYRYHPLFAESLQAHLRTSTQESSAQVEVSVYHQCAYRWFIDQGQTDEAIEHVLAAQQYAEAAACINESNRQFYGTRADHRLFALVQRATQRVALWITIARHLRGLGAAIDRAT